MNARLVMWEMGIRQALAPEEIGKRTYSPLACHTFSRRGNKFSECLHGIKVPQGYSSNIKKTLSLKDLKLVGL